MVNQLLIPRDGIAALIPHAGRMCLLEGVVHWNNERLRCVGISHRRADNPLRTPVGLPAVCVIEYAAQAMAVHGALTRSSSSAPCAGYLASVRDVCCRYRDLDELAGDLIVDATQLLADGNHVLYEFSLKVGEIEVLSGRAAAVLDISNPAVSR